MPTPQEASLGTRAARGGVAFLRGGARAAGEFAEGGGDLLDFVLRSGGATGSEFGPAARRGRERVLAGFPPSQGGPEETAGEFVGSIVGDPLTLAAPMVARGVSAAGRGVEAALRARRLAREAATLERAERAARRTGAYRTEGREAIRRMRANFEKEAAEGGASTARVEEWLKLQGGRHR